MKKFFLFFILSCSFFTGISQSQLEMNQEAATTYKAADKELNLVYQKILNLKEYSDDAEFIAKLKQSQRLWIQFRDSEMEMMFPHKDERNYYGTIFPLCWNSQLTKLTEERTKTLKIWLEGIEEGDACSGSIKIKE